MNRIVADGARRLRTSPEFRAQVEALRQAVAERHAGEWTVAGFVGRCVLRIRMSWELHREIDRLLPSPEALY